MTLVAGKSACAPIAAKVARTLKPRDSLRSLRLCGEDWVEFGKSACAPIEAEAVCALKAKIMKLRNLFLFHISAFGIGVFGELFRGFLRLALENHSLV